MWEYGECVVFVDVVDSGGVDQHTAGDEENAEQSEDK